MPVHNALPYLDEAVQSILDQTFRNFEFIIYDDGSTDGSWERLVHWAGKDSRIDLFRGERNLGPVKSSNEVVRHASAPLIARMDADDISMVERLQRQWEVLEANPDVGIVGSQAEIIDSSGNKLRRLARAPWLAPFPHGSMMVRRGLFDRIEGYREQCEYWEDLDFVFRAAREARIMVISDPLYHWRHSGGGTRLASDQLRVEEALDLRFRSLGRIRLGESYEDLLRGAGRNPRERIDPRVFLSLGSLALWAQRRPRLLRRLLNRGRLAFNPMSALALLWTTWASVSPQSLRMIMKLHSGMRNLRQRKQFGGEAVVEWRPPQSSGEARVNGDSGNQHYISETS